MAYLGNSPVLSQQEYRNIDNISGSFNGSTTSFALLVNGVAPVPAPQSSNQCLISVNGVVQKPDDTGATGFRISGGNIIFSSAPTGGQSFFGVILAGADYIYAGQNFPDGTVSAPSITFNQDLDTGFFRSGAGEIKYTANGTAVVTLSSNNLTAPSFIPTSSTAPTNGVYLPAANSVAISTGGSGRLFVNSTGNVGIGAANTGAAFLEVGGSLRWQTQGIFRNSTNTSTLLRFAEIGSRDVRLDTWDGTDFNGTIRHGAQTYLVETGTGASLTERLRITSAGLVGVGTSSPSEALTVSGKIQATTEFKSETGNDLRLNAGSANRDIFMQVNGSTLMTVQGSTGRVGIGTSSPNYLITANSSTAISALQFINSSTGSTASDGFLVYNNGLNAILSNEEAGDLRLQTGGQQRLTIDSSGRVGIGATPSAKLHVNTGTNENLWVGSLGGSGAGVYLASVNDSGSANTPMQLGSASVINFAINGTEAARIDSSRRLLVGTSSSSADAIAVFLGRSSAPGGTGGEIKLAHPTTNVPASGTLGRIQFGNTGDDRGAEIAAIANQTWTSTAKGSYLTFSTTADGASSPTERFRISSDGSFSSVIPGGSTLYPEFGCRAWVNFSGATPAIRASGNISSVTKNGAGQWTINFSTAMPDTNYTTAFGGGSQTASTSYYAMEQHDSPVRTTSAVKIYALNASGTPFDAGIVCAHIFR